MSTPAISVIVPIYNSGKYLRRCIDSILAQTYKDFELLLIDDGSTDNSGIICDEYAQNDSRVKVFHKQNGGVSSARNVGLDKANGSWIMFVDSDDTLPTDAVERLHQKTLANGISLVIAGYKKVDEVGNVTFSNEIHQAETYTKSNLLMQMFCPSYYPYWGYVWSKLFRRDIILSKRLLFDEQIFFNEDRLFCVEYICNMNGEGSIFLESCYFYHENASSAMNSLNKEYNPKFATGFIAYIKMYEIVKSIHTNKKILTSIEEGIENAYLWIMSLMKGHNAYDSQTIKILQHELLRNHLYRKILIIEIKNMLRKMTWLMLPKIAIRYKH